MSESAIRTAIYNIVSNVTDIGKVYDYERWAKDWDVFINFFKATVNGVGQIRGWEIGRKPPITEDYSCTKKHTYFIRGYMAVKDSSATEKTFNALIESIAAAFRAVKDLNNSAMGHDLIQVEALDTRMFGSVLCHFTELTLTVYENINE
jgi:hypothetical protein